MLALAAICAGLTVGWLCGLAMFPETRVVYRDKRWTLAQLDELEKRLWARRLRAWNRGVNPFPLKRRDHD